MSAPNRRNCVTRKVKTDFGSMYIQIDVDNQGWPVGGNIATPRKEPQAQITRLVETLSEGLNDALSSYQDDPGTPSK